MLLNDVFQKHPAEKTAFIFKDQFTTYGEFRKKVLDWAVFLQSQTLRTIRKKSVAMSDQFLFF